MQVIPGPLEKIEYIDNLVNNIAERKKTSDGRGNKTWQ